MAFVIGIWRDFLLQGGNRLQVASFVLKGNGQKVTHNITLLITNHYAPY